MSELNREDRHGYELLQTILKGHFSTDDADLIDNIQSEAEFIDLPSGGLLFLQGDHSDDVYFLLSGRLRAYTEIGGERITFGEIGRGETVGELALFTGEPRSASIVALRDSSLVKVTRRLVERALAKSPQIALQMTRTIIERFRRSERQRQTPIVPVNLCIVPISAGIDAMALAQNMRAARGEDGKATAIIGPVDIDARFGANAASEAVTDYIDEIETRSKAVYLVTDGSESAWTKLCLQHCDEIMLLADANQRPGMTGVETHYLAGDTPISIAQQTLVLLHPVETKSPIGTARWLSARRIARHFHIRPKLPRDISRIARIISGNAIGIVFAGGGAKGFAHVGVMKALEEAGIEVDFVGGTSIGAIMGMCLAMDQSADTISAAVHKAFLRHPKGNITGDYNFIPLVSLIKGKRTHGALALAIEEAAGTDIDSEDTWKTFFVIASDFSTGAEVVLDKGNLARNVIASYAIPGALPPMFIKGHMMFDGGTFNNFPVDVMARLGAGQIIGVDLSTDHGRIFDIDRIPGTIAHLYDKFRPRKKQRYRLPTVPETLITSSFISSLSKQKTMRRFADLLFQPRIEQVGLLEWKRYEDIVAVGYNHAKEILAAESEDKLRAFR
ncbi:patatin-like phospholipase family protein [Bradyrhizobium canariense]|uniref:NTE family protein n=1 Tax=Bradyrhizobium canariense TaxID=255045 RepID=A0A1H1MD06_9BRAD|nr:patatin-like phospholipase family protein [Bradyrhizobium canariense]SDR83839.1 NTE family protein [Bradyrhizobium canariense]